MHEERYQTGALLGRGGMAEVFAGVDSHLRRPVAIKRLREDRALDPTLRARFRREASAAARLNHPGIVAILDTAEVVPSTGTTPIPIIVMELIDGCTLRESLRDGPRLTPDRALEITDAILGALTASHSAGIIHRDIKPANVLLTSAGQVKVADFGIARTVSDDSATQTQAQSVMGSPHYMSPEQARGMTVDHRSDLYSVGCLLYELLVGQPPFTGDSPLSITFQHVTEPPPEPSKLDPRLSGDIDTVVMRALEKAPSLRYQTADQMRADISHVRSGHPLAPSAPTAPTAPPTSVERSAVRVGRATPPRRTRRLAGVIALAVLVVIGFTGFGYLRSDSPETPGSTGAGADVPADTVTAIDPDEGRSAAPDSVVTVTVTSTGPTEQPTGPTPTAGSAKPASASSSGRSRPPSGGKAEAAPPAKAKQGLKVSKSGKAEPRSPKRHSSKPRSPKPNTHRKNG